MKKWIIFSVLLLLLLTACQTVSNSETGPASSTPPSSSITPPPSSVIPPTSIPATTPPVTSPNYNTGYARIHKEYISPVWDEYDLSDCIIGYLYWLDKETHEVTLLLAEQIKDCVSEGAYIYYVKEAEPSKIYRMLIADPSQYELIHETTHGDIDCVVFFPGAENYLQFVANSKKFVVFQLAVGEETVLLERYCIHYAYTGLNEDGNALADWIYFRGQPSESDQYDEYIYNRITGELRVDNAL